MESWELEGERYVMKSMEIEDHKDAGIGNG
jgi:hypothetical protein